MTIESWRSRGLAAAALLAWGCSSPEATDNDITYWDDVSPIFKRCTGCHHTGSPIEVDIEDPFAPEKGLVEAPNFWAESAPGLTPERIVAPGNPAESFLLWKLGDPTVPALDPAVGGEAMPLRLPALTPQQIQTLETWVEDGADEGEFFQSSVRPIFGDETRLGSAAGACSYCHHTGTATPPNLTDAFGPDGVVRIQSDLDSSLLRVAPRDPERSSLLLKVRATEASEQLGDPMPPVLERLSAGELETVRRWIEQGARP